MSTRSWSMDFCSYPNMFTSNLWLRMNTPDVCDVSIYTPLTISCLCRCLRVKFRHTYIHTYIHTYTYPNCLPTSTHPHCHTGLIPCPCNSCAFFVSLNWSSYNPSSKAVPIAVLGMKTDIKGSRVGHRGFKVQARSSAKEAPWQLATCLMPSARLMRWLLFGKFERWYFFKIIMCCHWSRSQDFVMLSDKVTRDLSNEATCYFCN